MYSVLKNLRGLLNLLLCSYLLSYPSRCLVQEFLCFETAFVVNRSNAQHRKIVIVSLHTRSTHLKHHTILGLPPTGFPEVSIYNSRFLHNYLIQYSQLVSYCVIYTIWRSVLYNYNFYRLGPSLGRRSVSCTSYSVQCLGSVPF